MPCGCFSHTNPGGGGGGGSCSGTLTVCRNYHSVLQTSCTNPVITVQPTYGTLIISGETGNKKLIYVHDDTIPEQSYPQSDSFSYTCGATTCVITVNITNEIADDEKVITLHATGTCEVGLPTYKWTIPECAELMPGYTIYDSIIKVKVKKYNPDLPIEDQLCTFLVDVCCGNCNNCCTCKTVTYVPAICVTECGGEDDCDCELPCYEYNSVTGLCNYLCTDDKKCCGDLGEEYCAECCDDIDCPGDSICVAGTCKCPDCYGQYTINPLPSGICPCLEDCLAPCQFCDPITQTTQTYIPTCGPNEVVDTTTTPCSCKCILCLDNAGNCIPCPCTPPARGGKILAWNAQSQEYVEYSGECPDCQECVYTPNSTWECLPIGCAFPNSIAVSPPVTNGSYINPANGLPCSVSNPCCCIEDPCPSYGDDVINPQLIENNLRIKTVGACAATTTFVAWLNNTFEDIYTGVTWEINPTNYINGWIQAPGTGTSVSSGLLTVNTLVHGQGFLVRATYKGRTWQVEYWHDNCGEEREVREVFPSCTQIISYNIGIPGQSLPTITNNCNVTIEEFPGEIVITPSEAENTEDCLCVSWDFVHPATEVLCDNYEKCFTPTNCTGPCQDAIELLIDKTTDGLGNIVYHGSVVTVPDGNALMYACETPSLAEWEAAPTNINGVVVNYISGLQDNCGTLPNSGFANPEASCGSGSFNCTDNNIGVPTSPCGWVVSGSTVSFVNGANLIVTPSNEGKVCFGVNTICGYVCTCETITPPSGNCHHNITLDYTCTVNLVVQPTFSPGLVNGLVQIYYKTTADSPWIFSSSYTIATGIAPSYNMALPGPYAIKYVVTPPDGCPIMEELIYPNCSSPVCPPSAATLLADCSSMLFNILLSGGIVTYGGQVQIQIQNTTTNVSIYSSVVTVPPGTIIIPNITAPAHPALGQVYLATITMTPNNVNCPITIVTSQADSCTCTSPFTLSVNCAEGTVTATTSVSSPSFFFRFFGPNGELINSFWDNTPPFTNNVPSGTSVIIISLLSTNEGNSLVCGTKYILYDCIELGSYWKCETGECNYYEGSCNGDNCFETEIQCLNSPCSAEEPCEIIIDGECAKLEGVSIMTINITNANPGDQFEVNACGQTIDTEIPSGETSVTIQMTCEEVFENITVEVVRTRGGHCVETITINGCDIPSELFCLDIEVEGSIIVDPVDTDGRSIYIPDWNNGNTPQ